jgi:IS30 family transposase
MLTIEEIIQRKNLGKRKWRSSLIPYIQDHLDKNLPMENVASFLLEKYQLVISVDILYKIKRSYYQRTRLSTDSNITNQTNINPQLLHEKMNSITVTNSNIELGEDF